MGIVKKRIFKKTNKDALYFGKTNKNVLVFRNIFDSLTKLKFWKVYTMAFYCPTRWKTFNFMQLGPWWAALNNCLLPKWAKHLFKAALGAPKRERARRKGRIPGVGKMKEEKEADWLERHPKEKVGVRREWLANRMGNPLKKKNWHLMLIRASPTVAPGRLRTVGPSNIRPEILTVWSRYRYVSGTLVGRSKQLSIMRYWWNQHLTAGIGQTINVQTE